MGKTKTAVISGAPEEKRKKGSLEKTKKDKVTRVGLKGGERIKTVEAGPVDIGEKEESQEKKEYKPKQRSKQYKDALEKVNREKEYSLNEAIKLVKKTSYSKFDGTVELHMTVKKKGLSINVKLPHSSGKKKKVEIADENTIKKLKDGKIDFDLLLATADMMPKLVPFARILGPKGLMPNPKNGTVIKKKEDAKKFMGNSLNLKTEKNAPVIHTAVGKVSQDEKQLKENVKEIFESIGKRQITKATLTSTMGPGIKIKSA